MFVDINQGEYLPPILYVNLLIKKFRAIINGIGFKKFQIEVKTRNTHQT